VKTGVCAAGAWSRRLHLPRTSLRAAFGIALLLTVTVSGPAGAECRVVGDAPPSDLELARAACERAGDRFSLLFGVPTPSGVLEVSDSATFFAIEQSAPEWKLIWPTTRRLEEFLREQLSAGQTLEDAVANQWTAVLPHELGHVMLIAEADGRRLPGASPRRLPDWLHEGTAVWMEPPALREVEYMTIRARRPYVPPLAEIMAFETPRPTDRGEGGSTVIQTFYPCASEEACGGRPHWSRIFSVTTRQFGDGRVQVDTIFHERPPPMAGPLGSNFYAYSAALVRFLFDQGGARAMNELLTRAARAGVSTTALQGLPGLPSGRARLEGEWQQWFRRWIFSESEQS
jgi:hypothetical protein